MARISGLLDASHPLNDWINKPLEKQFSDRTRKGNKIGRKEERKRRRN
jgi:hypothetical protein